MGKLASAVLGAVLTLAAVFGGPAVWWWDRRPPNVPPPIKFHVLFWTPSISWPTSLEAQRDSAVALAKNAEDRYGRQLAEADTRAAAAQAEVAVLRARADEADARAKALISNQRKTFHQEIPDVITPVVDSTFPLSARFVCGHDAAVLGSDLSASCAAVPAHDAAGDVPASKALDVVDANYGACRADRQTLTDLQQYVRDFDAKIAMINRENAHDGR